MLETITMEEQQDLWHWFPDQVRKGLNELDGIGLRRFGDRVGGEKASLEEIVDSRLKFIQEQSGLLSSARGLNGREARTLLAREIAGKDVETTADIVLPRIDDFPPSLIREALELLARSILSEDEPEWEIPNPDQLPGAYEMMLEEKEFSIAAGASLHRSLRDGDREGAVSQYRNLEKLVLAARNIHGGTYREIIQASGRALDKFWGMNPGDMHEWLMEAREQNQGREPDELLEEILLENAEQAVKSYLDHGGDLDGLGTDIRTAITLREIRRRQEDWNDPELPDDQPMDPAW